MFAKTRTRSPNFTLTEKELLKELVRDYLKRKNVGKFAWKDRQQVWDNICSSFNEMSTVGVYRSKKSLKKFYSYHLRKEISESETDDDIDESDRSVSEDRRTNIVTTGNSETEVFKRNYPRIINGLDLAGEDEYLSLQKAKLDLEMLRKEFNDELTTHNIEVKKLMDQIDFKQETFRMLQYKNNMLKTMLLQSRTSKMHKLKQLKKLTNVGRKVP